MNTYTYTSYVTQINLWKLLYVLSYLYWTVTATRLTILIICSTITAEYIIAFNITHVPIYASYGSLPGVIPGIYVT